MSEPIKWWGYWHSSGKAILKRYFNDPKDYTYDVQDNPFVLRVVPPFEAPNRDEALKILVERLGEP
jgi:hypothetical protein